MRKGKIRKTETYALVSSKCRRDEFQGNNLWDDDNKKYWGRELINMTKKNSVVYLHGENP
jgi:hypothetical protein